jgi:hypothetical protein
MRYITGTTEFILGSVITLKSSSLLGRLRNYLSNSHRANRPRILTGQAVQVGQRSCLDLGDFLIRPSPHVHRLGAGTGEDEQQRALNGISEASYGCLPPSHLLPKHLSNNMTSSNTTELAELAAQLRVSVNDVSIGDVDEGFREIKKLSEEALMVQNRPSSSESPRVSLLVDAHSHPVSSDPNITRTSFGGNWVLSIAAS